jgi:hypothetical protein
MSQTPVKYKHWDDRGRGFLEAHIEQGIQLLQDDCAEANNAIIDHWRAIEQAMVAFDKKKEYVYERLENRFGTELAQKTWEQHFAQIVPAEYRRISALVGDGFILPGANGKGKQRDVVEDSAEPITPDVSPRQPRRNLDSVPSQRSFTLDFSETSGMPAALRNNVASSTSVKAVTRLPVRQVPSDDASFQPRRFETPGIDSSGSSVQTIEAGPRDKLTPPPTSPRPISRAVSVPRVRKDYRRDVCLLKCDRSGILMLKVEKRFHLRPRKG